MPRAPVADADRRVGHDRVRAVQPGRERGRVDIGLERRARLALGVRRPVELALAVILAAEHRPHGAVRVHHDHGGVLEIILVAVLPDEALARLLDLALDALVERRLHDDDAVVAELAFAGELLDLLEGPVEVVLRRRVALAVDRRRRVAPRGLDLALGQEARLDHVVEHVVGAGASRRQVDVRGVFGRRLEQPGEHRRFGERDVLHRLAEIILRRRRGAEGAAAHIGAVEIELEDVLLREMELEPDREESLLDLALERALVVEKDVLGELLRDRGAALHDAAAAGVHAERPEGADRVDAPMLEEAPVLGRERRLDQVVGEFLELHRIVVADAAAADLLAVAVEEGDRELLALQPVLARLAEGRQGERQHHHGGAGAERRRLAREIEDGALEAAHPELVRALGEALIAVAHPPPGRIERGVEPGVERQRRAFQARRQRDPGLPVKVHDGWSSLGQDRRSRARWVARTAAVVKILARVAVCSQGAAVSSSIYR